MAAMNATGRPEGADTPRQARLREQFEDSLRRERGPEWVEQNRGLLNLEWEFLAECRFL
jgi:hypothetical protein